MYALFFYPFWPTAPAPVLANCRDPSAHLFCQQSVSCLLQGLNGNTPGAERMVLEAGSRRCEWTVISTGTTPSTERLVLLAVSSVVELGRRSLKVNTKASILSVSHIPRWHLCKPRTHGLLLQPRVDPRPTSLSSAQSTASCAASCPLSMLSLPCSASSPLWPTKQNYF